MPHLDAALTTHVPELRDLFVHRLGKTHKFICELPPFLPLFGSRKNKNVGRLVYWNRKIPQNALYSRGLFRRSPLFHADTHLLNLLIEAVVSAERLRTDGFHNEKRNSELQVLQAAKKLKNWFPILQDQPCTSTSTRRSLKNRGFRRVSPMFGARSQPPVQRGSGLRSQPLGGWCFESKTW